MDVIGKRLRVLAAGTALLSGLALAAGPALAQGYPGPRAPSPASQPAEVMLEPQHADSIVRSLGLRPTGPAAIRGPAFVVQALGQEGSEVEVTIDRRSGRVMQITRAAPDAPYVAGPPPRNGIYERLYDRGDRPGVLAADDDDDDFPPAVGPGFPGQPRISGPAAFPPQAGEPSGPAVITRRGVESEDLPPPGAGQRSPMQTPSAPHVTGSLPPAAAPSMPSMPPAQAAPVDPLLGVPKEFRGQSGQQRTAAAPRQAETPASRAPLPRPRPADAPVGTAN